MTKEETKKLVEQVQEGQVESFAKLYDFYLPKIYRFIYYQVQHQQDAEDLTSLTFTKAINKILDFKNDTGDFSAWLYQIARHSTTDHWRTKKNTFDLDTALNQIGENQNLEQIDNKQLLEKVFKQLENLKPKQKEIIILRLWQELSFQEISKILNKSEASCKMYFSRSIKNLRQSLNILLLIFINLIH